VGDRLPISMNRAQEFYVVEERLVSHAEAASTVFVHQAKHARVGTENLARVWNPRSVSLYAGMTTARAPVRGLLLT
jgi:hypothetical protein